MANFDYLRYIVDLRRDFHARPEIAYCEFDTQATIIRELEDMGVPYEKVGTGVIARINLGREKTTAFRADIDALPILEANDVPYRSQNHGLMHACGHDGHTALLLGFAKYCTLNLDKMARNAVFIFQPAEEAQGGAIKMIECGALDGVDEIFAVHVDPALPEGTAGLRSGVSMAGAYEFDIEAVGESSHCAEKQLGKDAIGAIIGAIKGIYDGIPGDLKGRAIFHCGRVEGGYARNVVADKCAANCTIRYFDEAHLEALLELVGQNLSLAEEKYGVRCSAKLITNYIPLVNNSASVEKVKKYIEHTCFEPKLTAEDFAFFLKKAKGCLIWLGVRGKKGERKLHSPDFDFDESALLCGLEVYKKIIEEK